MFAVNCLTLTSVGVYGQAADGPTFEVASIKPALSTSMRCSGGPGTTDPGTWICSSVPLAFVITNAYGFEAYQFSPRDPCCQSRFDITAKVPVGTTTEQFHRMQQNLLIERFKLALHHRQQDMAIYELTVGNEGPKMKESDPNTAPVLEDPWALPKYSIGQDGCPKLLERPGGVMQGRNGCYRWTAFDLSMQEIAKTLSFYLGRPVMDATGLKGKYDIDMKWSVDVAGLLEGAGLRDEFPEVPNDPPRGPTLIRAVQDQLGLKLKSTKGNGDIAVIDHVEKFPSGN